MVRSGLKKEVIDDPKVSPTRLTLHFSCALSIYALLFDMLLDACIDKSTTIKIANAHKLQRFLLFSAALSFATSITGTIFRNLRKLGRRI